MHSFNTMTCMLTLSLNASMLTLSLNASKHHGCAHVEYYNLDPYMKKHQWLLHPVRIKRPSGSESKSRKILTAGISTNTIAARSTSKTTIVADPTLGRRDPSYSLVFIYVCTLYIFLSYRSLCRFTLIWGNSRTTAAAAFAEVREVDKRFGLGRNLLDFPIGMCLPCVHFVHI